MAGRNVPLPMAPHLENVVLPQTSWVVDAVRTVVREEAGAARGTRVMRVPVAMPKVNYEMEFGAVAAWQVAVGDKVEAGQVIADIETEKATLELEAPADGHDRGDRPRAWR